MDAEIPFGDDAIIDPSLSDEGISISNKNNMLFLGTSITFEATNSPSPKMPAPRISFSRVCWFFNLICQGHYA